MKYIEIDDELYSHIASNTQRIGESASDILRRLLNLQTSNVEAAIPEQISQPGLEQRSSVVVEEAPQLEVRSRVAEAGQFSELLDDALLTQQKGAVGRFLYLLDALYRQQPEAFSGVLEIRGRDRLYFATSKEELLSASKTANPKQIGDSTYWVTSNNNTAKKRTLLKSVAVKLGCPDEVAQDVAARI
ncbi:MULTISPECIES: replication initiation negative regulator SeqA [Ferrimonas]|uniref:Negative modulator of initiation of replication n=1 Tax=Ferrimonas sediminum TaxID=718193 RepID=A0A1G8R001_9GAMM|nr:MULTISPECIES: replication initiation negative regulator SeqA [Ferrimonas]USD36303.1 replication initiation negative regulator SeqA [Ferrimonas sp. SCSIO 43195]SDJ10267.1 negative regulator of replication initiation SeqA [Ferrimonas sediminum]